MKTLAICIDTDLGFETRRVEVEQSIACGFLLDELFAHSIFESF